MLELGLPLKRDGKQNQAVPKGPRYGDGVQAGELVCDKVVERHAAPGAEVFCRGDFSTAPGMGQLDLILGYGQPGVGDGKDFVPNIVLARVC